MPDDAPLLDRLRGAVGSLYRIDRELGQGGMAVVYLGHDLRHGRDVAVKVLRPEIAAALSADRFLREIQIAAQLQHPHILPLFDSGQAGKLFYYVMPFVEGESLRDRLKREGPIPVEETVRIGREVAEALHYAHERGVVHRDIKPENILLSNGRPLVADFGIARAVGEGYSGSLTATGFAIGTPHYMSPEQALADPDVDGRSDVYSLGCVIYEMLTGVPPYTGPSLQAIVAGHIQAQVPSASKVGRAIPRAVSDAVAVALAKDREDRYHTANQFAAALDGGPRPRRRIGRAGLIRGALAVAVGTAIALGGIQLWRAVRPAGSVRPNLVAVAPFNVGGQGPERWGGEVMELLAANLNGAGALRTVSANVARREWSGRADELSAGALARRELAGLAVFGTVTPSTSDSVRLTATIRDVVAGVNLADVEVVGLAQRMDLVVDSATVALIEGLSRTRPIAAVKLAIAQSQSLPALKAYLTGEQFFRRAAWDSANGYYARAAELDPAFAQAIHRIYQTRLLQGTGSDSLIWGRGLRAGQLNRGLPVRDSLIIATDSLMAAMFQQTRAESADLQAMAKRILAGLEFAAQRFPDDPEIWYHLGFVRDRIGWRLGAGPKEVLEAVDRAIVLDSAFAPAYALALPYVLTVQGKDRARRLVSRYLALDPLGHSAAAARLVRLLLDPRADQATEVSQLLDTVSALALHSAQGVFDRWPDSAETAVALARRLAGRARDPKLADDPGMPRRVLFNSLAWRGRLTEAAQHIDDDAESVSFTELTILGGVPPDRASRVFGPGLASGPPGQLAVAIAWWAARRDSGLLSLVAATALPADADATARYVRDAAGAYLTLVRGDSGRALDRFLALPEPVFSDGFGDLERLATVQLLRSRGRHQEALERIEQESRWFSSFDFLWLLERGRANEGLGRKSAAAAAYSEAAAVWFHADSALQPFVAEARAGLRRVEASSP